VALVITLIHILCHCHVDSKSRVTARGGVSFLQVNAAEALAEIFYGRAWSPAVLSRLTAAIFAK